jgi:6-pyruvoyltetrahydropterin/6-carboxytetrahydropterin synthase
MFLRKDFTFDSAHFLSDYQGKCEVLHGHTYHLSVTIEGEPSVDGMILDFSIVKEIVTNHILNLLDHHLLNDLFPNPTTEIVAQWIFDTLLPLLKGDQHSLYEVLLSETETSHILVRKTNA